MDELDITDDEMQALIRLGIIPEELAENRRQSELAEALRYGEGPEGRQAGRVYVAANPLEHITRGAQRFKAAKDMKQLGTEREGLLQDIRTGRSMFGNLLRGRGQMSPVGAGASPVNSPVSVSGPENFPMPTIAPIQGPSSPMAQALKGPTTPGGITQAPGAQMAPPPIVPHYGGSGPSGISGQKPMDPMLAALLRARGGTNRGMMF